ncbi:MAG: hypothetical protein LBG58_07020, partial [Planctomycetaceae bacterium]|nr:hypothetical protein [Planctomycetaceae bacterium]
MIDFSKLKTPEEKLIVLWLSHQDSPIQAKNIFETLNLNDHECRKNLRNLCKLGFVAKYTNEWGRDVFSIPSPVVSTPSLAVSTPSPVVSTPSPVVSTPSPVVSTPSPVVSTPSPVVLTPSPVVLTPSPVSEESGELTNLVLNETKQTNKKDQFEEFEKNQPAANILPATNTSAEQQRKPKP